MVQPKGPSVQFSPRKLRQDLSLVGISFTTEGLRSVDLNGLWTETEKQFCSDI